MMIDQMPLSGIDAYLVSNGSVNLAGSAAAGAYTRSLSDGDLIDIAGIELLIEADDLGPLVARQDGALLSIHLKKEIYPGLFTDPYAHRVHTLAGGEDFGRGAGTGIQMLEVDGVPTLVSTGNDSECIWRSAIYKMTVPLDFDAVAWDLAASRLTPAADFTHTVNLHVWDDGARLDRPASRTIALASDQTPDAARFRDDLDAEGVAAYQFEFRATVERDTLLRERYVRAEAARPLGRPLLRAIYLLESVTPAYTFHSLGELASASSSVRLVEYGTNPITRLTASLSMPALLTAGESLGIVVHDTRLTRVEARLSATARLRPPVARETGD